MTQKAVGKGIGLRMDDLATAVIPTKEMLAQAGNNPYGEGSDSMKATKNEVCRQIPYSFAYKKRFLPNIRGKDVQNLYG